MDNSVFGNIKLVSEGDGSFNVKNLEVFLMQ